MSCSASSNRPRIVIRGVGLVSPLGSSAWSTFSALLKGKTIHDRADGLPRDVNPVDLIRSLGDVATAQHAPTDPAVDLAECAAREALFMAGIEPGDATCYLGTSKGAVSALDHALYQHGGGHNGRLRQHASSSTPRPLTDAALAVALGPHGYLTHRLRERLECTIRLHTVAACASSLTALHQARVALTHPSRSSPTRLLVVTCEASLLPVFIHSYRRLGVLAPLRTDAYRCAPLDQNRSGFTLAQLGAAVVLERVDQVEPGQIELVDTAIATESHDLIRAAPGMPGLKHVAQQLISSRKIDLIHPHATGTVDHDPQELAVYSPLITDTADVYASKGALGHGLGASGLVSLVIASLCAQTNRRPPMPWLTDPINLGPTRIELDAADRGKELRSHAVFASGFGGHVAGAVIARQAD